MLNPRRIIIPFRTATLAMFPLAVAVALTVVAGMLEVVTAAEEEVAVIEKNQSAGEPLWVPMKLLWASPSKEPKVFARWWCQSRCLVLQFRAARPLADWMTFHKIGFREGLWEQDVMEFFILDRQSGHYREYNLSPGGAWWAAEFTAPRVRLDPQPGKATFGVKTHVSWGRDDWGGSLRIPIPSEIGMSDPNRDPAVLGDGPTSLEKGRWAVNFTSVWSSAAGRQFYSLAELGGEKPDFHQPDAWIKM